MDQCSTDRYELIIFDWDGTLVDSVPNIVESLRLAALESALPVLDDCSYRGVVGMSLAPALAELYPQLDPSGVGDLCLTYKKHHLNLEQNASRPFPGVVEGLEAIRCSGVSMAVATGKRRAGLQRSMVANGYEDFFHASRTADDALSKPSPDMIEQLLSEFSLAPHQVLMVGDSTFDMEMAREAGVDRAAVTYGAQPGEVLEAFEPVCIVDDFSSLLGWLGIDRKCVGVQ